MPRREQPSARQSSTLTGPKRRAKPARKRSWCRRRPVPTMCIACTSPRAFSRVAAARAATSRRLDQVWVLPPGRGTRTSSGRARLRCWSWRVSSGRMPTPNTGGSSPSSIRLIAPPLHEFLPSYEELLVEVTRLEDKGDNPKELEEKRKLLQAVG